MIELPVLGLLKEGPLHGYALKRRLESIVGYFGVVSYGSLYPMLHKMETHGHVRKVAEERSGKERITYQITLVGEERFLGLMRSSDLPLTLKMLFFQSLPAEDREWLLVQQRDEWVRKLEERRRDRARMANQPDERYRTALLDRSIRHLERDVAWIQNLIEGEERP
ncbi:MAG: PadR family transcriptional regulator [Anaerolineales bacterium]|nr:PadR family transcriptional regulator [Anaerolineales bacterium]